MGKIMLNFVLYKRFDTYCACTSSCADTNLCGAVIKRATASFAHVVKVTLGDLFRDVNVGVSDL